jgi:ATP-dependent exoDNAse (exonuclease V) beta subunit
LNSKLSFNEINKHERDSRLKFLPEPHIYLIDNCPLTISVSTFVKLFFTPFEAELWASIKAPSLGMTETEVLEMWRQKGRKAAALGTELHAEIEGFLETKTITSKKPEFNHFLNLYNSKLFKLTPYRSEWSIFDEDFSISGTTDMVFKKPDGSFAIYDWKRSKEIKKENRYSRGLGPCSYLPDCNFMHYSLQVNIYKRILQSQYGIHISEMNFVQLHPNQPDYKLFSVPDLSEFVGEMFIYLLD